MGTIRLKRRRLRHMNEFYEKLDELYGTGNLAAVEQFILGAVDETGEHSPARAGLYNELAGFYRGVSRYAESADMFMRSLGIFESAGMGATRQYATTLINLAGLYRLTGDADKAIELFKDAIKRLENAGDGDDYAYASVLNNLALAYQSKGESTQALEYANKSLEIMRARGGNEREIASSLNNLASIRLQLGETDTADKLISEALEIYGGMTEPDAHYAAALTTKAVLMCRKGDYRGSLDGFRRALELTRRFFGENIEFAICRRNISMVYELSGDIASAITELYDAIRVMEAIHGAEHASLSDARKKLDQLRRKSTP